MWHFSARILQCKISVYVRCNITFQCILQCEISVYVRCTITFQCILQYNVSVYVRCNIAFQLGSDRNFGSVRFGKNFAELFVIQFHAHLQYTGIKRTDYAILYNKSFSQQNSAIHMSTTPFYLVKLSACCGERFYIHASLWS